MDAVFRLPGLGSSPQVFQRVPFLLGAGLTSAVVRATSDRHFESLSGLHAILQLSPRRRRAIVLSLHTTLAPPADRSSSYHHLPQRDPVLCLSHCSASEGAEWERLAQLLQHKFSTSTDHDSAQHDGARRQLRGSRDPSVRARLRLGRTPARLPHAQGRLWRGRGVRSLPVIGGGAGRVLRAPDLAGAFRGPDSFPNHSRTSSFMIDVRQSGVHGHGAFAAQDLQEGQRIGI